MSAYIWHIKIAVLFEIAMPERVVERQGNERAYNFVGDQALYASGALPSEVNELGCG